MPKPEQLACRPDTLVGPWCIEPTAFADLYDRAMAIVNAGQLEPVAKMTADEVATQLKEPYRVDADGIAHVLIRGPMTPYPSSMQSALGGTSMLVVSRALDEASNDPAVKGILVEFNTPGGTVAGTADLASAVARARSLKPLHGHASGACCSGGYRIGIETDHLSADPMAILGSVGVVTQMRDTSELMKKAGVTTHYPASGDKKAAGAPGSVVTPQHLADAEKMVRDLNGPFIGAVASRRKLTPEAIADVSRAGVYVSAEAQKLGLIDGISSLADARENLKRRIHSGPAAGGSSSSFTRSGNMPLSNEQLAQAKSLPGCGGITADNAAEMLLGAATSLQNVAHNAAQQTTALTSDVTRLNSELAQAKASQQTVPPMVLAMAQREARSLLIPLSGTKLSPACADALAETMIGKDGEPVAAFMTPDATGATPASKVISVLAKNEGVLNAKGEQHSNAQPVGRTAPGADSKLTKEEYQAQLDANLAQTGLGRVALANRK